MDRTSDTRRWIGLLVLACVFCTGTAWAQQASGIAGLVSDETGGVLPGVTVEAASPALIEQVRTAVTDGDGRYNVVQLRPGEYTVTFSLPGFSVVRREGITLTAGFTAAVNVELQVGSIEETITVTGQSPLVDVQNVRIQQTISDELLSVLPSGTKNFQGIARLVPGMSGGLTSGGATGVYSSNSVHGSSVHGKQGGKMSYDGMQTSNLAAGGHMSYLMNPSTVEEIALESGNMSAESDASGFVLNLIPKEGGDTFSGAIDSTYTNGDLQGDNVTADLRDRGLTRRAETQHVYDTNLTLGGPLRRNRLWFFAASRFSGTKSDKPGIFFNSTQGTPVYTPDLERPAYNKEWLKSLGGRITWQASDTHKISGFADVQSFQVRGYGGNNAPEAITGWVFWPAGLYQATWTAPVTNRLLFEAGWSLTKNGFTYNREEITELYGFFVDETDVSILETSTGLRYNAKSRYYNRNDQDRYVERFSMSYVTGSHAFKTGLQWQQHVYNQDLVINQGLQYRFLRGVPTQITQWATPLELRYRTKADLGLYVQDQWTINRLTLNMGLRFDYFKGEVPAHESPAGPFVPARSFDTFSNLPGWSDLNTRLGVAYDLFGTGQTALKASIGRYVGKMASSVGFAGNPLVTSVNNVNRSWTDTNQDYVPDCDLTNGAANGECGPISNANFGQVNPNAFRYDEDLTQGFGNRDYFWDLSVEVQHEFGPRVSLTAGWYRNWTNHYGEAGLQTLTSAVLDNLAITPDDFQPYSITAPMNSLLPNGGGYEVSGLFDILPARFGQGLTVGRRPDHFGDGYSKASDFFTVSFSTRLGEGIELGGSVDTGRTVVDECVAIDSPQSLLHCRVNTPFGGQTQVKMYAAYPLPGDFSVSAVLQNLSGISYGANYRVSNAAIAPSLGRNLAACGAAPVCSASVSVPLVAPQTLFEPRTTVLDIRFARIFSLGSGMRLRANVDFYNVLNNSAVLRIISNYGSAWRRPTRILPARSMQIGGAFTF